MKWPANPLSHLNPIEKLWRNFKTRFHTEFHKLNATSSTSKASYETHRRILQLIWASTDFDLMKRLVLSMRRWVPAIIANNGGKPSDEIIMYSEINIWALITHSLEYLAIEFVIILARFSEVVELSSKWLCSSCVDYCIQHPDNFNIWSTIHEDWWLIYNPLALRRWAA